MPQDATPISSESKRPFERTSANVVCCSGHCKRLGYINGCFPEHGTKFAFGGFLVSRCIHLLHSGMESQSRQCCRIVTARQDTSKQLQRERISCDIFPEHRNRGDQDVVLILGEQSSGHHVPRMFRVILQLHQAPTGPAISLFFGTHVPEARAQTPVNSSMQKHERHIDWLQAAAACVACCTPGAHHLPALLTCTHDTHGAWHVCTVPAAALSPANHGVVVETDVSWDTCSYLATF